jgi:hypothetical protein
LTGQNKMAGQDIYLGVSGGPFANARYHVIRKIECAIMLLKRGKFHNSES